VNGVYSLIHHFLSGAATINFTISFYVNLDYRVSQNSRIPNSSVVGDHLVVQIWKFKKKIGTPPTKIHWSEGALFEVRFLQIQAEKFSVYCYLWCDDCGK
jgi:hypothetical protein